MYDLTRLVAELGQPETPKMALIDAIGLAGNPMAGVPEQQSLAMLRELYGVEILSGDGHALPEGTKVVAVAHPQAPSEPTLYALDRWVMGGGSMMAFVDPHAETRMGLQGMPAPNAASDFAILFDGWGVTFDAATAVADPAYALKTIRRIGGREANVGTPAWLRLDADAFDQNARALARLPSMVMTTVGSFGTTENGPTLVPLATASDQAVLAGASEAADRFGDPRDLVAKGTATETAPIVMARMSGPVSSTVPDGKPDRSEWEAAHLSKPASANVLLSGDAICWWTATGSNSAPSLGRRSHRPFPTTVIFSLARLSKWLAVPSWPTCAAGPSIGVS